MGHLNGTANRCRMWDYNGDELCLETPFVLAQLTETNLRIVAEKKMNEIIGIGHINTFRSWK